MIPSFVRRWWKLWLRVERAILQPTVLDREKTRTRSTIRRTWAKASDNESKRVTEWRTSCALCVTRIHTGCSTGLLSSGTVSLDSGLDTPMEHQRVSRVKLCVPVGVSNRWETTGNNVLVTGYWLQLFRCLDPCDESHRMQTKKSNFASLCEQNRASEGCEVRAFDNDSWQKWKQPLRLFSVVSAMPTDKTRNESWSHHPLCSLDSSRWFTCWTHLYVPRTASWRG